jgi:Ca2+-binding EF-hand superfamily protein
MDNLITVLKVYDENEDGFLTKQEFERFCSDIEYKFTNKERDMFDLNSDQISYDQILNAVKYEDDDPSDKRFYETLKSLDKDGTGKVFIPELINILKKNDRMIECKRLDELISNLPIEDHHLLIDKIDF